MYNTKERKTFYTQMRPSKLLKHNKDVRIRISTNATGDYKGHLTLITTFQGQRGKRSYSFCADFFPTAPKVNEWCNETQKFLGTSADDATNNNFVTKFLTDLQNIVYEFDDARTSKMILGHYTELYGLKEAEKIETPNPKMAYGEWLRFLYNRERHKDYNNSTNYQLYSTLLHKLEGRNYRTHKTFTPPMYNGIRLYDIPLNEIRAEHFEALMNWINTDCSGAGYRNLTKLFKTVYRVAVKQFKFIDALNMISSDKRKRRTGEISLLQFKEGKRIDADIIRKLETAKFETLQKRPSRNISYELTRDIVLFQYYTYQRPSDVILLKYGKPKYRTVQTHTLDETKKSFYYVPYKERNRTDRKYFIGDVTNPKAISIMARYKGKNENGYLFPLPMLKTDWGDITTMSQEAFHTFQTTLANTFDAIRDNLHAICEFLGIPHCSLYTFRRSAITHAIQNHGANPIDIANVSGTSTKMIYEHYYTPNSVGKVPYL